MRATESYGKLNPIPRAEIMIPIIRNFRSVAIRLLTNAVGRKYIITLNNLPEITDSKSSDYPDENIIGRSFPVKNYSHSGNRQIGMKIHLYTLEDKDRIINMQHLRAIQSAVYPDETPLLPYIPPPICKIRVGNLLTAQNDGWLCVLLKQYNCNYPIDVVWDEATYMPYKLDIDLIWEVVFPNSRLPGQQRIFMDI